MTPQNRTRVHDTVAQHDTAKPTRGPRASRGNLPNRKAPANNTQWHTTHMPAAQRPPTVPVPLAPLPPPSFEYRYTYKLTDKALRMRTHPRTPQCAKPPPCHYATAPERTSSGMHTATSPKVQLPGDACWNGNGNQSGMHSTPDPGPSSRAHGEGNCRRWPAGHLASCSTTAAL